MAGGTAAAQKKGVMLYDFMAQGDDEVTVGAGDEVIIIDDTKSEEWWQVRRFKNGKEGVVPSSYVEVTGTLPLPARASTGADSARSTVDKNRREELRLTKEAIKAGQREDQKERERRYSEVCPGLHLPERRSSLSARNSNIAVQQRNQGENGLADGSSSSRSHPKSKPDASKVRTWTDRSKSFSVQAQFLALKDAKLHLHKMNGVKIAVPVAKMSVEDLEYVEMLTGRSLDEDKPLSDLIRKSGAHGSSPRSSGLVGATFEKSKKPEYEWFQFFQTCDIEAGSCERYAQAFARDSMDESVLPDVSVSNLRTLGLREGDIIKVMRFLDNKYGRSKKAAGGEGEGGLFSGPGGTLRNNTRSRPAPPLETRNIVNANAFSSGKASASSTVTPTATSAATNGSGTTPATSGFDDDAWDVKPSKRPLTDAELQPGASTSATAQAAPATAPTPQLLPSTSTSTSAPVIGAMQELSLLTQPLQPEKTQTPAPAPALTWPPAHQTVSGPTAPVQMSQPTAASPQFFTGLPLPQVNGQGQGQTQAQAQLQRQRPIVPHYTQGQGGLVPPPPSRPLSAPQSAQPSMFNAPPLQPQITGYQGHPAPPGQSLNEVRMQHQYQQMQAQQQPVMPMMTGYQQQSMIPQPTGMMNSPQQMVIGPFTDPRLSTLNPQPTGYQGGFILPQQPPHYSSASASTISFLPPPLEPQRSLPLQPTGMAQSTGLAQNYSGAGIHHGLGGMNGMNSMNTMAPPMQPLIPQKTGPPPPVRFGMTPDAPKLMPQPTGRRANLAQATPQNPFGF